MSAGEDLMEFQLKATLGLSPEREYRFHKTRQWRFDLAFPDRMMAVEIEGGVYTNGRHTRGKGYENDIEKYNAAVALGWKVFRFTTGMVKSGIAIAVLTEIINGE